MKFSKWKNQFLHIQSFIQNEKENDSFILICWPTVLKNLEKNEVILKKSEGFRKSIVLSHLV